MPEAFVPKQQLVIFIIQRSQDITGGRCVMHFRIYKIRGGVLEASVIQGI